MPHRAKKRDRNNKEVIDEFERLGCSVEDLGGVGEGFPDLAVGMWAKRAGLVSIPNFPVTLLVEVKDGPKAKLTPAQREWHTNWKGQVCIVRNLEDVRNLVKSYRGE